jgi:TatD DNase family protein
LKGLFDSHCHLYAPQLFEELDDVVRHAHDQGVTHILVPAEDYQSSVRSLEICSAYHEIDINAAVGIQPQKVNADLDSDMYTRIKDLVTQPRVAAIGEIGLDYYWTTECVELQKEIFKQGLELAVEYDKPIVLHNRASTHDMLLLLEDWLHMIPDDKNIARSPGVFHAFNGDPLVMDFAIQHSFCLGVGGVVTFKNAKNLQKCIPQIPLELLLIETDAPYLSPHPMRGKRNEPAFIRYTVERLAELVGIEFEELVEITTKNAERLFKIGVK